MSNLLYHKMFKEYNCIIEQGTEYLINARKKYNNITLFSTHTNEFDIPVL